MEEMTLFERIVGGDIFVEVWRQMRNFLFKQSRLRQLVTLKPIEIYSTETELVLDNMKVLLDIDAYLENIVQRRIDRAKDLLSMNFLEWKKDRLSYTFNVVINAKTGYDDIANFFDHHFANRTYRIVPDKYSIHLEKFITGVEGTKACVELPFYVDARLWFIKKRLSGTASFSASISFNNPQYTIRTRNLNYTLKTKSWLLKIADYWYHHKINHFLTGFLVYNFQEEIFHARVHAQEQLNDFQQENEWVNGTINELELERLTLDPDAVRAVFHAEGKLHLV